LGFSLEAGEWGGPEKCSVEYIVTGTRRGSELIPGKERGGEANPLFHFIRGWQWSMRGGCRGMKNKGVVKTMNW